MPDKLTDMSPEPDKPDFFVFSKQHGTRGHRAEVTSGNKEEEKGIELSSSSQRSMEELQTRLEELAELDYIKPSDGEVTALKAQRKALIREAESVGLFSTLRKTIADKQEKIGKAGITYDEIAKEIANIDAKAIEDRIKSEVIQTKGNNAWNPSIEGAAEAYKEASLLVMQEAWEQAMSKTAPTAREKQNWAKNAEDLRRKVEILSWGSIPEGIYTIARVEAQKETTPQQPQQGKSSDARTLEEAVYRGQKRARQEVEPSLEQSLELFHKAERLCSIYEAQDLELIKQKFRATGEKKEIDIFEREVKVFHAALLKRRGANTMTTISENSALKDISEPDLVLLMKEMPGYLEAMQTIADIVVHRKTIPSLTYSLLDCLNENQFLEATQKLDDLILPNIIGKNIFISNEEAKIQAERAINTAINTMFAFNVFEKYKSYWEGKNRHRSLEAGSDIPAFYDRLVSKPIYDAMHPIDDLITEALKAEAKKPIKNNITKWATTQMSNQGLLRKGIKKLSDFEEVRVLDTYDNARLYWRLRREGGKKVLLVPPIRPAQIGGSVLDAKINLKTAVTKRTGPLGIRNEEIKKIPLIEALAGYDERSNHYIYDIDLDNTGIPANFSSLYTVSAKDLDTIKDAFRDKKTLKDWAEIKSALGSYELGNNMELIAWMYVDLADAIDPKSRIPKLLQPIIFATRYDRKSMSLPRSDKFNILRYLRVHKAKEIAKNPLR